MSSVATQVPRQYIGLARTARSRFVADALITGPLMRAITDRAFGLYRRRSQSLRPEQLLQIEQEWRVIPSLGCLGLSIVRDRKNMIINDIPLSSATCTNSLWEPGATEAAICLIHSTVSLTKLTAATTNCTLAAGPFDTSFPLSRPG